jgi:hypothetical protein
MKYEFAMKWADALESGEYQQSKGRLKTKYGYCCLGVACEISGATWHDDDGYFYLAEWQGQPITGCLSPSTCLVLDWGVSHGDFIWQGKDGKCYNLIQMNDCMGSSFTEIAKVIREHWEEI